MSSQKDIPRRKEKQKQTTQQRSSNTEANAQCKFLSWRTD